MGRVLLCLGKYAEKPYFVGKAFMNVYSIEELCYCLMQNAYLLDVEITDKRLVDWIAEECELTELAEELYDILKQDRPVSDFVRAILKYTGYADAEELNIVIDGLKNSAGLTVYEKKKKRGDYFIENKKYILALRIYDILLEELPDAEMDMKAKVYHNRGVACAGVFHFQDAAESFKQAYDCGGGEASYIAYLAACRLWMDETEYVDFAARQRENYELSLKVESLMETASGQFEGTEKNRMLFTLKVCKEEGNSVSYYEEIERIASELKENYRDMVAE